MISQDILDQLARKYQTPVLNIVREYFQHLFLAELYKSPESDKLLFKGGTALRIVGDATLRLYDNEPMEIIINTKQKPNSILQKSLS